MAGNPGVLRKLADVTGGVAYFPDSDEKVVESFDEIAGNIRRGYSIGYVPTNPHADGTLPPRQGHGVGARPQQPQRTDPRWLSGA